ncbi:MAG: AbrB/MazE/SpoVT family DNA-binding domain-containing protein [Halanaerobiales bacterium]
MARAKITSRGQVTIPKKIREKLGADRGKELEFEVIGDREALIKIIEKPTAEELAGSLNPEGIEGEERDWKRVINKEKLKKWETELKGD